MEASRVQRIARVLNVLVLIALICNIIVLYLVPAAVLSGGPGLLGGVGSYLGGIFRPGEDDILAAGIMGSFLAWIWFWRDLPSMVLTLFLVVSGICTACRPDLFWSHRKMGDQRGVQVAVISLKEGL